MIGAKSVARPEKEQSGGTEERSGEAAAGDCWKSEIKGVLLSVTAMPARRRRERQCVAARAGNRQVYIDVKCRCGMDDVSSENLHGLQRVEEKGSYGEKQIARMLNQYGIRFFYEYPLAVIDRGKVRVNYPDFLLPDLGAIIEYAGMMDNPRYVAQLEHKKAVYREAGVGCVVVEPADLGGYWPGKITNALRQLLENRVDTLDRALGAGTLRKSRE